MKWPEKVVMYTDGACRGNPGPSSLGIYVTDSTGEVIAELGERLGQQTNNFAEYAAVVRALEWAKEQAVSELLLRSDSQLLVRQLQGQYKVKAPGLKPLYLKCMELARNFKSFEVEHVRREFNVEADRLANEALDQARAF